MGREDPIFVSYYTEGGFYENYIEDHVKSLEKFGLQYDIYKLPKPASWNEGTFLIVPFLKEMLKKHQRPLCYLDIDTIVVDDPRKHLQIEADVGYCFHDIDMLNKVVVTPYHDKEKLASHIEREILSGTLFLNPTPGAVRFLKAWQHEIDKDRKTHDQNALQRVLQNVFTGFSAQTMHGGLIAIEGTHEFEREQYIRHLQCSRGRQHALCVASPDRSLEAKVKKWGMSYCYIPDLSIPSLLKLLEKQAVPMLVLSQGARLHRRPFYAEFAMGAMAVAIAQGSEEVIWRTLYLTPSPECRGLLVRVFKGADLVAELKELNKKRLLEVVPYSYIADQGEYSFVKSPTISYDL